MTSGKKSAGSGGRARRAWGSLSRRADRDGYWLRYVDAHGGRRMVRAGDTRREADTFARTMQASVERARNPRPVLTLAEFAADEYLPMRAGKLAYKTWSTERGAVLAAAEHFGATPMRDVTAPAAESWLLGLGLSPATLVRYRTNLSVCWKAAIARNYAEGNPWPSVRLPRVQEHPVTFLSQESLEALYGAVGRAMGPAYESLVTVLGETGLRLGEALALEWRDVVEGGVVVRRSKSGRVRTVPLTDLAQGALERPPDAAPGDLVLAGVDVPARGELTHAGRRVWRAIVKELGLPGVRLHDLRHARGSLLVRAGVPIPTVARWLGHTTPALVLRVYGHHAPEDALARALETLQRSRTPRSPRPEPDGGSPRGPTEA